MAEISRLDTSRRTIFESEHELLRDQVRKFFASHLLPHLDRWEEQGIIDRAFWTQCGEAGLLCPGIPEEHGGLGLDFRANAVIGEELAYAGSSAGIVLQSDVTADYIAHYGSPEQKATWLPRMISGEAVVAIAMTEPGTGSDLQAIRTSARREGDELVVDGAKTYITNGQHADLVILVAKTDPTLGAKGLSLVLVEADRPGFARGRNLDKIGQHSADTSELFFEGVRVPATNVIGQEGRGFAYLVQQLPQERLTIAVGAQASAQRAFDEALSFTRERKAFGKAILDFQATRFTLAEMASELQVGWAHLDWAIARHVAGELTVEEAAAAKLFHSELQNRVCDRALQLHGGAGYMNEYAIARLWRDARVSRIYGGTSEIMKEVIGRAL
ncbi:acyl-CoA dehydrogenase family protein [Novosphingobium mangrovi (ex Hu et al. 2023)]|uniref:Acyl-[acyl-carrier-protein] dehydrogenase MbtN n=1 Tax=Novosphingobium mangrovi (ex Hu et al. 2023) TaxID=2930094 RepID=A0ABT0A818_9SPHN|nr:acyl-CoA dehydrogenase family protein [Novosphingobium mangrovi (ex Hu et al. 2023)]MCJ1959317.1 acyl-CoA dehydrogenase family protein [Novosphingobium mangrovi (ex Hu et al. 2023)]